MEPSNVWRLRKSLREGHLPFRELLNMTERISTLTAMDEYTLTTSLASLRVMLTECEEIVARARQSKEEPPQ